MEYLGPNKKGNYSVKFVRVDGGLYVTEPDEDILHCYLADAHGVSPLVDSLKKTNPSGVDAGKILFYYGDVRIYGKSEGLLLPIEEVVQEARALTAALVRTLTPGWNVNTDETPEQFDKHFKYAVDATSRYRTMEQLQQVRQKLALYALGREFTENELALLKESQASQLPENFLREQGVNFPLAIYHDPKHHKEIYGVYGGKIAVLDIRPSFPEDCWVETVVKEPLVQ